MACVSLTRRSACRNSFSFTSQLCLACMPVWALPLTVQEVVDSLGRCQLYGHVTLTAVRAGAAACCGQSGTCQARDLSALLMHAPIRRDLLQPS